jgi:putative membrane protein
MKTFGKYAAALVLGLAFTLAAGADQKDRPLIEKKPLDKDPANDVEFVAMALAGDIGEVKMAEVALKKSKNQDVRKFAERMIKDHSMSRDMLLERAKFLKVAVAEGLDPHKREMMDRLHKLEGSDFDNAYWRMMVEDHEKALRIWGKFSRDARDEKLRELARTTVPTIKDHLEQARRHAKGA